MPLRLHTGGRFRRWLGHLAGGDELLGERIWRRVIHLAGLVALLYYLLPTGFFVLISTRDVVYLLVLFVVAIEVGRHLLGIELPTIRELERKRVASYVYYALALAAALLLFPPAIGAVAIAGTALVDPLIGELRVSPRLRALYPGLPLVVYAAIALVGFAVLSGWPLVEVFLLAAVAAVVAVAAERPKWSWMDDDFAMTLAPALVVLALAWAAARL
jgi:dolichol kinase